MTDHFVEMSISCSICHEHINFSEDEVSVLNCGHLFHQGCLQQWLDTRMTCPECRCKVAKKNIVQKLYPSVDEEADLVYKGSSDETKSILENYDDQTKLFKKQFIKRIVSLEEQNKQLAEKNSKLQENISSAASTVKFLQEDKQIKDEKLNKLTIDNEQLKAHAKTLKQRELKFGSLEKENKKLKDKLSSIINNLFTDDSLNDFLPQITSQFA